MNRLKKLKKIRLHREGTEILIASALLLAGINALVFWAFDCKILFYLLATASIIIYLLMVNFFRCPIRLFEHDTEKVVVAPADGRIVVIEEVDEHEYFHDRRLMISIFMSIVNVHANWYPVDGVVKHVDHHNGKFMKAPSSCNSLYDDVENPELRAIVHGRRGVPRPVLWTPA